MPSLARVSVKPTWASLAAAGCQPRGLTHSAADGFLTRVICLAKVAKQASGRRRVDNATVLLFPEVRPCCPRTLVGALDVDLEDQVPVLVLDILEADVSQDTGVVDEHIDAAKCLDRGVDDLVAVLYGVIVCDGLPAGLLYLVDDDIGSLARLNVSVVRGTTPAGQAPASNGGTGMAALVLTFESLPSPLKDPPRSLTTTLAPLDPKKVAYALPKPPPAPVTTTTWPSNLNWPAMLDGH